MFDLDKARFFCYTAKGASDASRKESEMAKIDPKRYPELIDGFIPCPFHLIATGEEVKCEVQITKKLTIMVQCPRCRCQTFFAGKEGFEIMSQIVKEYKQGVKQG